MYISYEEMLKSALVRGLSEKNSIETILEETLNTLILLERQSFLDDNPDNKGNGFYDRTIRNGLGKYKIRVPRDRKGLFKPHVLEILKRTEEDFNDFVLDLYSHGLSVRSVEQIMKKFYSSSYSPSKISTLAKRFHKERMAWEQRKLDAEWHMIMIDAIHIKVRRDTVENEAFLIVLGLRQDMTREVLGLYNMPSETSQAWSEVFCDLKRRGVKNIGLVVSDELSGITEAVSRELPMASHQLCLLHKTRNLLKKVRNSKKKELIFNFKDVFQVDNENDTLENVEARLELFLEKWTKHYPSIANQLVPERVHQYAAYLKYPTVLRRMFYTTNWIERLNKEVRKVTKHAGSFPNPDSALNIIFSVIMRVQEKVYRRKLKNTSSIEVERKLEEILYSSIS